MIHLTDTDSTVPVSIVGKQLLWSVEGILQTFGKLGTERGWEQCRVVGGKFLEDGLALSASRDVSVQTGANGSQLSHLPFADSD